MSYNKSIDSKFDFDSYTKAYTHQEKIESYRNNKEFPEVKYLYKYPFGLFNFIGHKITNNDKFKY